MKEGKKLLNYLHTTFKKPDKITELWNMKELTWNNVPINVQFEDIKKIYDNDEDVNVSNIKITRGNVVTVVSNDLSIRGIDNSNEVMGHKLTPTQFNSLFSDKNAQMKIRVDYDIT